MYFLILNIRKKLDKNGQKPRQNAHSQKLDKNARQHAPNGKKQIDLKKLSWKNVCSLAWLTCAA